MKQKPDFDSIKLLYEKSYSKALQTSSQKISTDVEDWYSVMNEVQFNVYNDIKYVGIFLYPLYPIGDYFIDFGNPFAKIGIEILYKDYGLSAKQDRINFFEANDWKVYTIESKNTYLNAFELFDRLKNPTETRGLDQVEYDEWWKFICDNKETNSQCLIYYIKQFHKKDFFPNSKYVDEDSEYGDQ